MCFKYYDVYDISKMQLLWLHCLVNLVDQTSLDLWIHLLIYRYVCEV